MTMIIVYLISNIRSDEICIINLGVGLHYAMSYILNSLQYGYTSPKQQI